MEIDCVESTRSKHVFISDAKKKPHSKFPLLSQYSKVIHIEDVSL